MALKILTKKIKEDDCPGLAAEMAYHLLLSFIPGLIFIFSLLGLIGKKMELYPVAVDMLNKLAPPHTVELLSQTLLAVVRGSSQGLTYIGFGIALWSASHGARVLIKGLDRASNFSEKGHTFWYFPTMSLVTVVSLGLMMVIASNLIVFGDLILNWLSGYFSIQNKVMLINLLRWVIAIGGITLFTTVVYSTVFRFQIGFFIYKETFTGALCFVILWLIISILFGVYVENFRYFNPVYGVMGGIIILMTWMYLSALSLLIGGEIAAYLIQHHHHKFKNSH
jgi:membrane protein